MNRPDDLAGLFAAAPDGPGQPVRYRQGVVLTWDPDTAENTVLVGGTELTNLPILNTSEALLLDAGSVVGLITVGPSWAILGRLTIPGTADAATALGIITDRLQSADVATSEPTLGVGSFGNLSTVGPTVADVHVGPSRKALVIVSAAITVPIGRAGDMGVAVSGDSTIAASGARSLTLASGSGDQESISASRVVLLTAAEGLNAGVHTFTAQYRATVGAVTFAERNLTVMPF